MRDGSPFGKILAGNLIALLLYSVGLKVFFVVAVPSEQTAFVIMMALVLVAHVGLDLLLALVLGLAGKRDAALGFLASAPLVLLVGGGVCFGGGMLEPSEATNR